MELFADHDLFLSWHSRNCGLGNVRRLITHSGDVSNKDVGGIAMTNAQHKTENLTIHIKVKDYSTWRSAYDGRELGRVSAGISNGRVFRGVEDPNDVVILQDVANAARARAWVGSDDVKAAMLENGVVGSPNVRFAAAA
jgi:hypothetical protein